MLNKKFEFYAQYGAYDKEDNSNENGDIDIA